MEKTKIEEILEHQEYILSSIDKALDNELLEVSWEVDSLRERLLSGLRWGLFLRSNVDEPTALRTTTKFKKAHFHDDVPLVRINFQEIQALEKSLAGWGIKEFPIFSPKIDKEILKGEIEVDFSYESLDADVTVDETPVEGVEPLKLLDIYELRLTLPDLFEAFGLDSNEYIPNWLYGSCDTYENWKWSIEENKFDYYLQIGGHGRWIQGSYTDTYIAQVNNEVGDAGAVFINVSELGDDKFRAWVDMH